MRQSRVYALILSIALVCTVVAFLIPKPTPSVDYVIEFGFSAGEKWAYVNNWTETTGGQVTAGKGSAEVTITSVSGDGSTFNVSIVQKTETGRTETSEVIDTTTMLPLFTEIRSTVVDENGTYSIVEKIWWDQEAGSIRLFVQGAGVVEEPINRTVEVEPGVYDDWSQLLLFKCMRFRGNLSEGDAIRVRVLYPHRLLKRPREAFEVVQYRFSGYEEVILSDSAFLCERWETSMSNPAREIVLWVSTDEPKLYVRGFASLESGKGEEKYELNSLFLLTEVTRP